MRGATFAYRLGQDGTCETSLQSFIDARAAIFNDVVRAANSPLPGVQTMQIDFPDVQSIEAQAHAAGYATIEDYVLTLLDRDAERIAIQRGVADWKAGRVRSFAEFDAELRDQYGFKPRA